MKRVSQVSNIDELEECVGARPAGWHLKSIPLLDEHCDALLAVSPFAVLGVRSAGGSLRSVTIGGEPGVARRADEMTLTVPLDADPDDTAVGVLSFVPGYRETLRVNGRIGTRDGADVDVHVGEAFLHCAKAIIRSKLWGSTSGAPTEAIDALELGPTTLATVTGVLDVAPFITIASADADGAADVSPKGDPAGKVITQIGESMVAIADRPGNRRTDTMHNLMSNDAVSVLVFVPGSSRVVELVGRAGVTGDTDLCERFAVNGKPATAAVTVDVAEVVVRNEPAIDASRLWDASRHVDVDDLPKATRIWVDHVKLNDDPGLAAKAARRLANVRMLDASIRKDYRENLY